MLPSRLRSVAQRKGEVLYKNLHAVTNAQGNQVVMTRNVEISIVDEEGREREHYPVNYGAQLYVNEGDLVEPAP